MTASNLLYLSNLCNYLYNKLCFPSSLTVSLSQQCIVLLHSSQIINNHKINLTPKCKTLSCLYNYIVFPDACNTPFPSENNSIHVYNGLSSDKLMLNKNPYSPSWSFFDIKAKFKASKKTTWILSSLHSSCLHSNTNKAKTQKFFSVCFLPSVPSVFRIRRLQS